MSGKVRILAGALCAVMVMSGMAFAQPADGADKGAQSNAQQAQDKAADAQDGSVSSQQPAYITFEGEITSVTTDTGYLRVEIGEYAEGMVLILDGSAKVVDREGKALTQSDLKEGMYVFAVIAGDAPMTMSLPPQTAGTLGLIVAEKGTELNFDLYYEMFRQAEGSEAEKPDAYVELRALAEAKGYTVTWVSHKKPITLTKDDITATVTIGSAAFTYSHLTRDIQPLDRMEALSMPAKLENGKTMVPQSFIDALK